MKIGFVGGGTGGHFYPLVAVMERLNENPTGLELYYFGPDPYNQTLLDAHKVKFIYCPAGKLRLYFSIQNVIDIFRNLVGVFIALTKLYIIYPDVIFSKGGYTSVPILIAARCLRIPVVIHESDAVPGRANLLAKNFARYIAISYPATVQYFAAERTALTGIPLRRSILADDTEPFKTLGIPDDLPLIYVTGGSSGAENINNILIRSLDSLLPHYRIYHQTGNKKEETALAAKALITDKELQSRYYITDYVDARAVSALLSAASLVITRAGSTTLFEIAVHGKPSLIIPIPEDISRDQRTNAYTYARTGAATVIEEKNLTESLLTHEIHSIIGNPDTANRMGQAATAFAPRDAAEKIATLLRQIGHEHES